MKRKMIQLVICIYMSVLFSGCGAVSNLISSITSADCDNWLLSEIDDSLSETCRNLDDYLDVDSSSLTGALGTGISSALPVADLVTDKSVFLQLTDSNGDPFSALELDDVAVAVSTDEGNTYTDVGADSVKKVSEADSLQVSILSVIDYSGSILDDDLTEINSGLNQFYDNIISDTVSSVYQSGVMKFSTDVTLIQDFTSTKSDILAAVDDTNYTREYTSLYDGIYDGVTQIKDENTALKMIILFTDGVDNDSTHTKTEAINYAKDNNVAVCVVGVGFASVSTLEDIADETGCFYIYKTYFTSLDDAFVELAEQINNFQIVELPDSFSESSGIVKVTVDNGVDSAREILRSF